MKDKVVIVTGASSGIGYATSLKFAEAGATVVAVGRSEKDLNVLRDEANGRDGSIRVHLADVRETKQVDRLVADTVQQFGRIDVLVNCAGIIQNGSIESTTQDDFDKMLDINLRSVFNLIQKSVPHLEATKGNVVSVSSVAGSRAFPNLLAYCVSKAAVDQLTRCAALDLAPKGVRINAVNPGVVVTNLHKRGGMADDNYTNFLEHSKSTHPLGRVGQAHEIADLIYFLASPEASWITGVTYEIDGGRALTCAR